MNKLAWIGLLIAAVGAGFFLGAGVMDDKTISAIGLLVMFGGVLIMGVAFLKEALDKKRGF